MDTSHLQSLDQRLLWHPFTQMQEYEAEPPLVIERGDGVYLIDSEGNRYIDGVSSLWATIHGHRHPKLDAALKAQIDRIAHSTLLGIGNRPSIELAEKLLAIAPPNLRRVFYSDNGSTAVEIALKMAFQYWRQVGQPNKRKFLKFSNAYHGDTIGAVSVGGIDLFHGIYGELCFETLSAMAPYCYRCPIQKTFPQCGIACVEEAERLIAGRGEELAAVIIEPRVQGAAGMLLQPEGFLPRLRAACDRAGVLLIFDEVATGFGRTGKMFACEHEKVWPDLLCVAKGISGGYLPLAATLATDEIYRAFLGDYHEFKAFFHGHTYTGNPLACAVGLASLAVFEEEAVLAALQAKIGFMSKKLNKFKELENIGDIRHHGFMVGIELIKNKGDKSPYPIELRMGAKVCKIARREGILIRPLGNVIVLMPPLSISELELERLLDGVYRAIAEATSSERLSPLSPCERGLG